MRVNRAKVDKSEPVGIVIADRGIGNVTTRFSAFVWGPVPDDDAQTLAELQDLETAAA